MHGRGMICQEVGRQNFQSLGSVFRQDPSPVLPYLNQSEAFTVSRDVDCIARCEDAGSPNCDAVIATSTGANAFTCHFIGILV